MTLILGAEHNGKVYLAGDRFAGDDVLSDVCFDPKVWKMKVLCGKTNSLEIGFGFSGNFRAKQLIQHSFSIPKISKTQDPDEWMNKTFFKSFSDFLSTDNHLQDSKSELQTNILIGFCGKLYIFQSDFSMLRMKKGFSAIGPVDLAALSVFSVLEEDKKLTIQQKMTKTIESVSKFTSVVRPPVDIIEI